MPQDCVIVEIRHVLCPLDFSDLSRRALDYAIAVARWYRSRLTVLYVHHVATPSLAQVAGLVPRPAESGALSRADCGQLVDQLRALTPSDAVKQIPVEFSVAEGDVTAEILAAAESAA